MLQIVRDIRLSSQILSFRVFFIDEPNYRNLAIEWHIYNQEQQQQNYVCYDFLFIYECGNERYVSFTLKNKEIR